MRLEVAVRRRIDAFELDVDFVTERGITALFGPSGAGKTSTLRCIAGLDAPDGGRVVLDGRTLFDAANGVNVPARMRRVGFVFQQYALFPHLDVARNVGFGLTDLPRREQRERVGRMLEMVGLGGFGERRVRDLSGGQQQRVALARALAPEPSLLLLDEPFAAVDLRLRQQLRTELRRIHEATGTPLVLVTHDLHEVRQLADSLVLLDEGRVITAGPVGSVLDHPAGQELLDLLSA